MRCGRTDLPRCARAHADERTRPVLKTRAAAYLWPVGSAAGDRPLDLQTAAVITVSRQGRIEYWSPGATALFGYDAAQMIGSKVSPLVPEEFHARHWAGWGRAWRENGFAQGTPVMIPVVCADGVVRRFVSHLLPVHAPHGELIAVTAVWAPPSERDAGVRLLT
jgi:PAS domain S-box-containing protein